MSERDNDRSQPIPLPARAPSGVPGWRAPVRPLPSHAPPSERAAPSLPDAPGRLPDPVRPIR